MLLLIDGLRSSIFSFFTRVTGLTTVLFGLYLYLVQQTERVLGGELKTKHACKRIVRETYN